MYQAKVNRIGETRKMKNGLSASIINYRNIKDIDIQFEDGFIKSHVYYQAFSRGNVEHPDFSQKALTKEKYLGMERIMKNGMTAKIVQYRTRRDVDILFEDNTLVLNKRVEDFLRGSIGNPNIASTQRRKNRLQRLGKENIASNGQMMTIIDYDGCDNVTVQFEDGTIVENVKYECFISGNVVNPNCKIMRGVSYNELICSYYFQKIGFEKVYRRELSELKGLELDLYHPNINGYKIAIEYDGYFSSKDSSHTIEKDARKNKICKDAGIIIYRIREPQLPILNSSSHDFYLDSKKRMSISLQKVINQIISHINRITNSDISLEADFEKDKDDIIQYISTYRSIHEKDRLGETRIMKNGMKATIVRYNDSNDIDIQFEDGVVVSHRRYDSFLNGKIGNPNISAFENVGKNRYVGLKKKMKNGLYAEVVDYRTFQDIDVRFEDGFIRTGISSSSFRKGEVGHPKREHINLTRGKDKYLNKTLVMKNGMSATIVEYHNFDNVDIQFEDGTITRHKSCSRFLKGNINYPKDKEVKTNVLMTTDMSYSDVDDYDEYD